MPAPIGTLVPLMSVAKAAEFLGVSEGLVYKLTYRRELSCRRIGNRVLIAPADLEAYLESVRS